MPIKDVDRVSKEKERLLRQFQIEDEKQIDSAVEALLGAANGRKLLWWILGLGGLGRNPFTNNALTTGFNCGELNVSQKILERIIQVNPAGYAQMVTENADERQRRDTILNGVGDPSDGDSTDEHGDSSDE